MISSLGKLGVILIGLAIFGCAEEREANWKYFYQDEDMVYYYDIKSITHPSDHTVTVWIKEVFTEKFKNKEVFKQSTIEFPNADHIMILVELNCSDKIIRFLSAHLYSKDKKTLFSKDIQHQKFWFFPPEKPEEVLYKAVCNK
jgi:hypothetical protein